MIIAPTNEEEKMEAEDLKKKVMGLINPCRDKICIRGVRKRGDGKIVVEAATDSDLKKIVEHESLKEEGLTATRSGALNPKIVVYDVPRSIEPSELAKNVYDQNGSLLRNWCRQGDPSQELSPQDKKERREKFCKEFVPRFKIGKREGHLTSWVLEVSPEIRNLLRIDDKVRIYLDWQSCKIQDYKGVTRCYNCQLYGHVAKFCIQKSKTCSYCSKEGHMIADCPDKKEAKNPTCAACKKARKKADHSVNDKMCPAYKAAYDRVIERTDYGNNG